MRPFCYSILAVLLLLSSIGIGQVRYYQTFTGSVLDSTAYTSMREAQFARLRKSSPNAAIKETLTEVRRTRDSVVFAATWRINLRKTIQQTGSNVLLNKPLPMPTLYRLDGRSITLSDLKGKPTLLNFWFTTCSTCAVELPMLNQLRKMMGDSVNFVAVTFQDRGTVRQFLKHNPFAFEQIVNARFFTDALNIHAYPVHLFLDQNGTVVQTILGIPYVIGEDRTPRMADVAWFAETLRELIHQ